MQWRVEQAHRHRQIVHRFEHRLEVGGLGDLEFGEGGGLGGGIVAEDEPPHDRQPVRGEEHVLGATEADALGAEFSAACRIGLGVGVRPDSDVPGGNVVGPGQQRVEFGWCVGAERVHRAEVDVARRAVDRDLVAGPEDDVADRDRPGVDVDLRCADDGGNAPPSRHDSGVADEPTALGEDAPRCLHAEHVVGRRLGPHEDDRLAALGGLERGVGGQHDAAARRPRGRGQPTADRLDVVDRAQAGVEEDSQIFRPDRRERGGDRRRARVGERRTHRRPDRVTQAFPHAAKLPTRARSAEVAAGCCLDERLAARTLGGWS